MLRARDLPDSVLPSLLTRLGLRLVPVGDGEPIPGSYWGPPEAGLLGTSVHVRADTPVHSVLHEAAHVACMDPDRRGRLHTDARGDDLEESAVCYLQLALAREVPALAGHDLARDMDDWGYSFRLGSTRAWLEQDAEDARAWLLAHGLLECGGRPTFRLRGA